MNYLKKEGTALMYILVTILTLSLFVAVFSYFNIINEQISSILKIIIPIIGLFAGGFYIGKNTNKAGWIEGLKLGIVFSIILIIFNFLAFNNSFKLKYCLFYIIIIFSSILGSMIGINKRKSD